MDKEKLQRIGWTVPDLLSAVAVNERGVAVQGIGPEVAATAQKIDRTVRTLDRVGRVLRLGGFVGIGASARGASAFVSARDRRFTVGLLGGEVRDLEGTLATIGTLVVEA